MIGKKRTREHIIADLSVNYFERQALFCGFAVEGVLYDYGFDLVVWTYDSTGEIEPDQLLIQVKATDSMHWVDDKTQIALRVERRDLNLWIKHFLPVFLILYDAQADRAYGICIQAYFQQLGAAFDISQIGNTYTVYFGREDILDTNKIQQFAEYKRLIANQINIKTGGIFYET
jgi:hypothetical protein